MREELGRIIRGEWEETWSVIREDNGLLTVHHKRSLVAGDTQEESFISPAVLYASNAPRPVKDKLLARVLFADERSVG